MARYVTRAHKVTADWNDDCPLIPSLSVPDHKEVDTGILDPRGKPIFRAPREMGFGRDID
jgi:hypothetical protein